MSLFKSFLLTLLIAPVALALPPEQAQKLYEKITPSLVVVQYNYAGELQHQEILGQGVVVSDDGVVMTSMFLFPPVIPDEQMKDFKIIIPGDDEKEYDAEFLGRDERSDMAFLKVKNSGGRKWQPVKFEDVPTRIAEPIISVGLLPKDAGYKAYYSEAIVSANLRGPVPMVMVSTGGLSTVGSPVFNADGKAVGFVEFQQGASLVLNRNQGPLNSIAQPARFFVPTRDFAQSLASPPNGKPLPIPWVGAHLKEVSKDVAEYYDLKNIPMAGVGEVIPNSPASRAGLQTGDMITKVNGQALERGDEPEETPAILVRKIARMNPGEKVTFSVVRTKDKPPIEVQVTLEERPMQPSQAKRAYFEDLGFGVRQLVFADTYTNRLPADTKGVVVSVVRPSSSASSASLQPNDIVTQLNKEPVTSLDQFKQKYEDFRKTQPHEQVVLVVTRKQRTEVIKLEPPQ